MVVEQQPLPSDDSIEELYDDAPCGFVSTSADGTLLRTNRTFRTWVGRDADELVGRTGFAQLLTPGSRLLWLTHHVPQLQRAGSLGAVVLDLDLGSTTMPVLVSATLVQRPGQERPIIRLTAVDARERRVFEAELVAARRAAEKAQWRIAALQRVTQKAAAATTVADLFSTVAAAAVRGFAAGGAAVWAPDGSRSLLGLAAACDLPDDPAVRGSGEDVPASALAAWRSGVGQHVGILDPALDPALRAELDATDSASLVSVPLTYDGDCLGVVVLYLPEDVALDDADLRTVQTIGTVVGQAAAHARVQEELRHRAHHDALTGLANRTLLHQRLRSIVDGTVDSVDGGRDPAATGPTALLFVDLDRFKAVNDTHGHEVGDRVLVACAKRMSGAVRSGDLVVRTGGDEFVVLCESTDAEAAQAVADRIAEAVRRPIRIGALEVRVGASVGVAASPELSSWDEALELMTTGDAAMYAVKHQHHVEHQMEHAATP